MSDVDSVSTHVALSISGYCSYQTLVRLEGNPAPVRGDAHQFKLVARAFDE